MAEALRPLAETGPAPGGVLPGVAAGGIDGTPAIRAALPKAASRRLDAAFAKVRLVSVVALGTHQPLAAVAGPSSEGES